MMIIENRDGGWLLPHKFRFPRRTFLSDLNELHRIRRVLESSHTTEGERLLTAKYVSKVSLSPSIDSFN